MKKVGIVSLGHYAPKKVLTNADLEKMVETTDEWIMSRTGIRERHIAENETTSDMAREAAKACLEGTNRTPGFLISSCGTSDRIFPSQSASVAKDLGLYSTSVFDVNAACSGFIVAMATARSMIQTGMANDILVTASEKMTAFTDYTDRTSCVLFGDGAGAALLSSENFEHEILAADIGSDASGAGYVTMGDRSGKGYFWQDGKNIYRFVVTKLGELIAHYRAAFQLSGDNYYIIPHQANSRMFETVAANTGVPLDRFILNIEHYGNTSSASIGIALDEAARAGRFKKGDKLMLLGFGAGLTWAGMVIEW